MNHHFRFILRTVVASLLVGLVSSCSGPGNGPLDSVERTVLVDGKNYRYRVRLPKQRDPNTKVPVMLYLHGSGVRGDDNFQQADAFSKAIEGGVRDRVSFIVVLPQCKADSFWAARDMADYALAALDAAVKEFNGDPDRLYLAGFSLGGYGTWQIAAAHPGKFAALMPVAGGVVGERPIEPRDREVIIPEVLKMLDSSEPYKAVADAIGRTPVWAFHGTDDENVPVDFTRKMVNAMRDVGNKEVRYSEYPGEKHMIFARAFREPGFLEWLGAQKLK